MMMMRVKPNNQHIQHQHNNKIASPDSTVQKNFTFLPMLCSSTNKQVKLSHRRCGSSSSTTSSSITEDPSSPKVGCMGQVKKNNKVIGFPSIISFTSSTSSSNSSNSSNNSNSTTTHHHAIKCHEPNSYTSNNIVKYNKIKRFFSTKSPTSVITATRAATRRCQKGKIGRKNVGNVVCSSKSNDDSKSSLVNLVEMDPPLPVVKKIVQPQEGDKDGQNMSTLWRRRSGGTPLKCLQVQVTQHNLILSANTV